MYLIPHSDELRDGFTYVVFQELLILNHWWNGSSFYLFGMSCASCCICTSSYHVERDAAMLAAFSRRVSDYRQGYRCLPRTSNVAVADRRCNAYARGHIIITSQRIHACDHNVNGFRKNRKRNLLLISYSDRWAVNPVTPAPSISRLMKWRPNVNCQYRPFWWVQGRLLFPVKASRKWWRHNKHDNYHLAEKRNFIPFKAVYALTIIAWT